MSDSVSLGDTMRISTALLQDIHAQPHHHSVRVRLVQIVDEADGSKTLWVERVEEVSSGWVLRSESGGSGSRHET